MRHTRIIRNLKRKVSNLFNSENSLLYDLCPTLIKHKTHSDKLWGNVNICEMVDDDRTNLMLSLGITAGTILVECEMNNDTKLRDKVFEESTNVNITAKAKLDRDNIMKTLEEEIEYNQGNVNG